MLHQHHQGKTSQNPRNCDETTKYKNNNINILYTGHKNTLLLEELCLPAKLVRELVTYKGFYMYKHITIEFFT